MEPFDIDNIVKNKLSEGNDLHAHEMESAKPFVWSSIRSQIDGRKSLTWYHLAAAALLLMISFSFILFNVQKGHHHEMELLSVKIDQLQTAYMTQAELLRTKNTQVETLDSELKNVEVELTNLLILKPLVQKEKIVHQVDTVYIKQVEYITEIPDRERENSLVTDAQIEPSKQVETIQSQEMEIDNAIFPSTPNLAKNVPTESIQIKIGLFSARKN